MERLPPDFYANPQYLLLKLRIGITNPRKKPPPSADADGGACAGALVHPAGGRRG